jgi:hypothetical protein
MNRKGESWLTFAGLMLILAGALDILNGIWAWTINEAQLTGTTNNVTLLALFSDNLDTWAWIYLIFGSVLVAAGFSVFTRARWAVTVGIVAGLVGATLNMLWILDYPLTAFTLVALNVLVVYGLTVYGLGDESPAR